MIHHGLTWTFGVQFVKVRPTQNFGFRRASQLFPSQLRQGKVRETQKLPIRVTNNGDKDITIVPFTLHPTLFWLGPLKQVSKQAKLHLIHQHSINPNIVLHRSVYMGLRQRLRGCALMRTCWKKRKVISTTQLHAVTRCSNCFFSFSTINSFSCSSGTQNDSQNE